MTVARHPRPKELEGVSLEEIMKNMSAAQREEAGLAAFEDAKIEGFNALSTVSLAPAVPASTATRR